jgi:hypothetical protein
MKLPDEVRAKINRDVGDFLIEQIIQSAEAEKSPISGEGWPSLSKAYKEKKIREGLGGKANLTFEGDLLDALTYKQSKTGIEIGWFGKEAPKADGHANISGKSRIRTRRLIPDEGQMFKRDIKNEIEMIVAEYVEQVESERDLG